MRQTSPSRLAVLMLLLAMFTACTSDYHFSSYDSMDGGGLASLHTDNSTTTVTTLPVQLNVPQGDNSYVCACRILIPTNCTSLTCGLFGTWPTPDGRFCDLGPREAAICFPRRFATIDEADRDCSGRVRTTVLLALRSTYSGCRGEATQQFCGIRIACTAITQTGSVKTRRTARCEPGVCWPEAYLLDASNARTATYVSREYQEIFRCSEEDVVLTRSEQDVCGELL